MASYSIATSLLLLTALLIARHPAHAQDVVNETYMREKIQRGIQLFVSSSAENTTSVPANIDYTLIVNSFIGAGYSETDPANVFCGASVPFGVAKFGIDVDDYAPAGYNTNYNASVRGLSLLHDSGTGSYLGSYGNFESLPLICSNDDHEACPTTLDNRKRRRAVGKDAATPGYFTTTLDNDIKLEATTTRRAGLIRYTWTDEQMAKQNANKPYVIFDWSNDLPGTFRGGEIQIDPAAGRIMMNGSWGSSWGSSLFTYHAFACYDLHAGGEQQIDFYGLTEGDRFGQDFKAPQLTFARQPRSQYGGAPAQRGALISWSKTKRSAGINGQEVLIRAGLSFVSAEQACRNAEEEVPAYDFDGVVERSKALWNEKLRRLQVAKDTDPTIIEMLYTSFYRAFLSPNNATGEAQGAFSGTSSPYFDGLYCSWDTFRTFMPFLSLTRWVWLSSKTKYVMLMLSYFGYSPQDYAEITDSYIDSWRKQGFLFDCRANNVNGFTQGGSDATNILADFAVKYRNLPLGVSMDDLYKALYTDATETPFDWASGGRQIDVYDKYGYVPFGVFTGTNTGPMSREGSRTLEYAFNDFGTRNVALLLGKIDDAERWTKRALNYKNVFDKNTKKFDFDTFVQRRYVNGSFDSIDPTTCTLADQLAGKYCSLSMNNWTVYETTSFEYSFWAPHDLHGLIDLIVGGSREKFVKRLDTFFEQNLFYTGNEPSFQIPASYMYANEPTRSVDRVRHLVFNDFNTTSIGIPGNDDNGAMATLLLFHLLGLFPVPSTREFLIVSPFVSQYTLFNTHIGNVTFTAQNFDKNSVVKDVPANARAYVKSVTINGVQQSSRCKISFDSLFPAAATSDPAANAEHVNIVFEMATKDQINGCGSSDEDMPSSMSTGGFDKF